MRVVIIGESGHLEIVAIGRGAGKRSDRPQSFIKLLIGTS